MASPTKSLFYLERSGSVIRAARVSVTSNGKVLDELRSISSDSKDEVKAFVQDFSRAKAGQLMRAVCAVYPADRIFRHHSLKDSARPSDPKTMEEIVTRKLKLNPAEYMLMALNADDGTPFDGTRANREILICGGRRRSFQEAQEFLVECGVYPVRLELGSVATAGMYLHHMRTTGIEEPVMLLEIDEVSAQMVILSKGRVDSTRQLSQGLNSMIGGVRQELGLKDEGAARRLFFSDSFDFREMGPRLVERLLRELQAMIGFYEVQTGQSLRRLACTRLPSKLNWLNDTFASSLGMRIYEMETVALLAGAKISPAADQPLPNGELSHGLLSLMLNQ